MANLRFIQRKKTKILGREIIDELAGGRGSEEIGVVRDGGVEKNDHEAVQERKVGQDQNHHEVLQQIHRVERRVRQEIALRHARAEDEHALDDHALRQRQRQNGDETPDRVGLGMDGGGAVGVGVELRIVEEFFVGMDAFDDESRDGNLKMKRKREEKTKRTME